MRAAIHRSAGEVVVEDVPDAALREPADAVVRVVRACVCGSDLWAYRGVIDRPAGSRLGHEFIAWEMAFGMARVGGRIGSVGVPHTTPQLGIFTPFRQHLTLSLGIAPVRHYLPDLLGRALAGGYDAGRVFDLSLPLERVADGYQAMSERRSIKTMLEP